MSELFFLALVLVGSLLFMVNLQNFLQQGKLGQIKLADPFPFPLAPDDQWNTLRKLCNDH